MIYPEIKTIHCHIPKTGGTTLRHHISTHINPKTIYKDPASEQIVSRLHAMCSLTDVNGNKNLINHIHGKITEYREVIGQDFDSYYVLSIVRNPFDRLVSLYSQIKSNSFVDPNNININSFEEFILENNKYKGRMLKDSQHLLYDGDKLLTTEVFPFDYYEEVLNYIGNKLNFKVNSNIRLRKTKTKHEYTLEMRERVMKDYDKSYELWKTVKEHWEEAGEPYKN